MLRRNAVRWQAGAPVSHCRFLRDSLDAERVREDFGTQDGNASQLQLGTLPGQAGKPTLENVVLEQIQVPLSLSRSDSLYSEYSLRAAMPPGAPSYEASHVAYFGDWDQDGTGDLVVGLPMLSTGSSEAGGAAIVLLDSEGSWNGLGSYGTGSRTALLANGHGGLGSAELAAKSRHGHSLVGNIDLDGNGVGDLVLAAPFGSVSLCFRCIWGSLAPHLVAMFKKSKASMPLCLFCRCGSLCSLGRWRASAGCGLLS